MGTEQQQSTGEIMIALLRSIDASLKVIAGSVKARAAKTVATDRDLAGQYGDPQVRLTVRDWTGPSMKGRRMSECPPEFLDLLAETLDYIGDKEEREGKTYNDKPTAPYKRQDAARARGWAQRMRSGRMPVPQVEAAPTSVLDESALGFAESGFEEASDDDVNI